MDFEDTYIATINFISIVIHRLYFNTGYNKSKDYPINF